MKKNMTRKLLSLIVAAVFFLSLLTACGGTAGGAPVNRDSASADAEGAVLLSINPEIKMDYDDKEQVVALIGVNEDGKNVLQNFTGYEGQSCTEVIGKLVDQIHADGYFENTIDGHSKNLIVKLAKDSEHPSENFLDDLAETVRQVVEEEQIGSQTVALDDDDYDEAYGDKGYINAEAAQNLLAT